MQNGLASLIIALVGMLMLAGTAAWAWERHRDNPDKLRKGMRDRWRSLRTRWSATAYLAVHFLIGFGACLATLALFSLITIGIERKQRVTYFDMYFADAIHRHSTDVGILLAQFTSALADPRLLLVVFAVGATLLWLRHRGVRLAAWIVAFCGASVLDVALRLIFRPDRPAWSEPFGWAVGSPLPGGHVLSAVVAWGMVAYMLVTAARRRPWSDGTVGILLTTLLLSIGFSRIYLGLHYVTDVIAGLAAGTLWLATCVAGIEIAQGEQGRREGQRRAGSRGTRSDRRHESDRRGATASVG